VEDWDQYNLAWIKDTESRTDVVNGFIEVYNDPLGKKGSFESVVSFKDMEATKRIEAVSKEAQWFEDNSPLMEEHKKPNVTGIIGKVITVVVEAGDASPSTPIGINLPNNGWVREVGSKSVSLGNIVHAYEMSSKEGKSSLSEFAWDQAEIDRSKKYGGIADLLHTDLHEVIGHASGRINEGVGTTSETLKSYASCLEEGRADLVALYYLHDQKLVDMGLIESLDAGKTAYDDYIKNGMMLQLKRLDMGDQVEEAHMRNRQMIAKWAFEAGAKDSVIVKKMRDGKTFFVINDYEALKDIFGMQLRELQRIKSEGDYEAGKSLVEDYAVKVDPELHAEVLKRYETLGIAPYGGFINPKLVPVMADGKITDIEVQYPETFREQMMFYGENYSFLPVK
jgi:dipeptidyl-peptidase-3